ncbi:hypothetical protein GCM10010365_19450 [Streptomyces poonensis]|uniref:Uncharacterized protein n=1 Tax=Streptomyces poonensis TaxID=68255 RepID=A0A918PDE3_9ACTN|nr:hypothetical protein GCM10010365_19450 [Streptomyces poonensis]GLJ90441.1 hypothetical protein GCM10017589_30440 [Streptomyces poonensis]
MLVDVYGDLTAKLWAAEALADAVAAEGQRLHDDPDAVTERTRGEFEVRVARSRPAPPTSPWRSATASSR